ncbi:MAG: hypothetical protein KatS3mg014_2451 [Actinomycetota bacterium]|nr:MAG: hypothetical protein KatS3mg014_2451 [Actinomycetota bacterium]
MVAASNAPLRRRRDAHFVCDGTADEVEINQAIAQAQGATVVLTSGTFFLAQPVTAPPSMPLRLVGQGPSTALVWMTGFGLPEAGIVATNYSFTRNYVADLKIIAGPLTSVYAMYVDGWTTVERVHVTGGRTRIGGLTSEIRDSYFDAVTTRIWLVIDGIACSARGCWLKRGIEVELRGFFPFLEGCMLGPEPVGSGSVKAIDAVFGRVDGCLFYSQIGFVQLDVNLNDFYASVISGSALDAVSVRLGNGRDTKGGGQVLTGCTLWGVFGDELQIWSGGYSLVADCAIDVQPSIQVPPAPLSTQHSVIQGNVVVTGQSPSVNVRSTSSGAGIFHNIVRRLGGGSIADAGVGTVLSTDTNLT